MAGHAVRSVLLQAPEVTADLGVEACRRDVVAQRRLGDARHRHALGRTSARAGPSPLWMTAAGPSARPLAPSLSRATTACTAIAGPGRASPLGTVGTLGAGTPRGAATVLTLLAAAQVIAPIITVPTVTALVALVAGTIRAVDAGLAIVVGCRGRRR
jgi:hypothetical protein